MVDFDGLRYVVSHRAILTVVVSAACNAACFFCSNEITFTPSGPYLTFDAKLRRVRDFALLAGVKKVAYTGGEPTLNPSGLTRLMAGMSPGFQTSRLHTNGWGLLRQVDIDGRSPVLLDALVARGLTGVSISLAHHDPEVNRRVMALPKSWSGMTREDLLEVSARASTTFNPRLSCVLTADGVSGVDDMLAYIDWGVSLGYRRFIFRSCSDIPTGYKKPTAFTQYNDVNVRSIEPLSREFQRRTGAELRFRQRKSDSKVDVFAWRDVVVDIDESSEEPDPDHKVRRLNVMPDGATYTSWIAPDSNLFDDDREIVEISVRREPRGDDRDEG